MQHFGLGVETEAFGFKNVPKCAVNEADRRPVDDAGDAQFPQSSEPFFRREGRVASQDSRDDGYSP